jgi:hypothetical protein
LNKPKVNLEIGKVWYNPFNFITMNSKELFLYIANKYNLQQIFKDDLLGMMSFYSFNEKSVTRDSGLEKPLFESNIKLHENLFGIYSCSNKVKEGEPNTIILGIKDSLIPNIDNEPSELCEMIALHEICHYIDWQKLTKVIPITLTDCDKKIGIKFDKLIIEEADVYGTFDDPDHNASFGSILYNLIKSQYPNDVAAKMQIAVSKTLSEDYTSEWSCM